MSMPAEHMTSIPTLAELLHGYADAPSVQAPFFLTRFDKLLLYSRMQVLEFSADQGISH
ncbi:MAG: hypothetical protein P8X98_16585 [Woeseiaceae bacterium]